MSSKTEKEIKQEIEKDNQGELVFTNVNGFKVFTINDIHIEIKEDGTDTILHQMYKSTAPDRNGDVKVFYHHAVKFYAINEVIKITSNPMSLTLFHKDENKQNNSPDNIKIIPRLLLGAMNDVVNFLTTDYSDDSDSESSA